MSSRYRILLCELHQETNTFNPIDASLEDFKLLRCIEGREMYDQLKVVPGAVHGMIDAIEEAGGEVVPVISMEGGSGGKLKDEVVDYFVGKVLKAIESSGSFDGVYFPFHGATVAVSEEDVCGSVVEKVRKAVGEERIIAVSFDLHANVTEKTLANADVVCGYQSYPHMDFYETGYRAASLGMRKLIGKSVVPASTIIPMMVPPAGYSSQLEPFKSVIDYGKKLVEDGLLLDFTVFQVQPWMDLSVIGSTVIAVAEDEETAKKYSDELAQRLFENRDGFWPDLMTLDEVIERAEKKQSDKPIVLVDASDSPNGGAAGDSVAAALKVQERGSKVHMGLFVKDPEAVEKAFKLGVGSTAEFSIGAGFTPNLPGPFTAEAVVRSLHDGEFVQEGPAGKGFVQHIGRAAVVTAGSIDFLICDMPRASGDPQLFRHFGIEPTQYDIIVVKANTSFRVPYRPIAEEFCYVNTPGAGTSDLKSLPFKRLPKGFYPFDLPADYKIAASVVRRR